MEYTYKLDGVYISSEVENSIIIHLAGFNEEKKHRNWWYYPEFTNINTLDFTKPTGTVKDALNNLYNNLKEQIPKEDTDLVPNLDRTYKDIERNIKLIINCILYLSSQQESLTKEYPKDIPNHLISKIKNAKTKHKKEVAIDEIKRIGFTKITFARLEESELTTEKDGTGTGTEVSPHWRRGHWRKQPYGTNLSEIKLIWIKPTIVRKDMGSPKKGHIYEVNKESTDS